MFTLEEIKKPKINNLRFHSKKIEKQQIKYKGNRIKS